MYGNALHGKPADAVESQVAVEGETTESDSPPAEPNGSGFGAEQPNIEALGSQQRLDVAWPRPTRPCLAGRTPTTLGPGLKLEPIASFVIKRNAPRYDSDLNAIG